MSIEAPDEKTRRETRKHIRGSNLLFLGRLISLAVNLVVQVITVRYLSKSDYGAFAYAMSVAGTLGTGLLLGLNRTVNRSAPIHEERGEYGTMFGLLVLAAGTITVCGLGVVVLANLFDDALVAPYVTDQLTLSLLLILLALAPMTALDRLLQGMLAMFAGARAVFFRRYVLGPGLKLLAVGSVVALGQSARFLAAAYVVAGALGVLIYGPLLWHAMRRRGLIARFDRRSLRWPVRELAAFSLPLFATDLTNALRPTLTVLVLGAWQGAIAIADYRAFIPVAGLNLMVIQSMRLLYTPAASRLYGRDDHRGLDDLFARTATWITIVTFPMFAVCVGLTEPVALLLFGEQYVGASSILVVLAIGNYVNAAMGLNAVTLQVYGRVGYLVTTTAAATATGLGIQLWLVPRYGAMGAAVGTAAAAILQNVFCHGLLLLKTPVDPLRRDRVMVYVTVALLALSLHAVHWITPNLPIRIACVIVASLLLIRLHRSALDLAHIFPEIRRVPVIARVLGVAKAR